MYSPIFNILVTGANGFVGRALCAEAIGRGLKICGVIRSPCVLPKGVETFAVEGIDGSTDWGGALTGVAVVIHLAARVHVMNDPAHDPLAAFRHVNVDGTLHLARQAAAAGLKRFIFISSIKVNGEATQPGKPFTADDPPASLDPYAISKAEAEQSLLALAKETGMEVVIIRPPLVYGPGVKANFLAMMRFLRKGVPLPLGAINNKRSMVGLDNLVDLIITCIDHPAAANQIFLAGDGEDLSTTELLKRLGRYLGKPARLLPVPRKILEVSLQLVGRSDLTQRLCGSLQVDTGKARELLGWVPPVSVDVGLHRTARSFLETGPR